MQGNWKKSPVIWFHDGIAQYLICPREKILNQLLLWYLHKIRKISYIVNCFKWYLQIVGNHKIENRITVD